MQERTESWLAEPALFLLPLAVPVETVDLELVRAAGMIIRVIRLWSDTEDAVGGLRKDSNGMQVGK